MATVTIGETDYDTDNFTEEQNKMLVNYLIVIN